MRIGILAPAIAGFLAVLACEGSSTSPATADRSTVSSYEDLSQRVQSAALSYDSTMSAPTMTAAGCAAVHDAYDAQVRPWISRMVQMGGAMDAYIEAHGGSAYADMTCVANAMMSALDAHRLVACTFAGVSDDQIEAARHVGVMTSYSGHVSDRCGQMTGGLDGHGYRWGPIAPGCGGTPGGTPTDPVALGERIFERGIGTDGQPIVRTGGYMMMGGGCASCHGFDGHGLRTMMFTTPNITYANLTDPAGMREPDGSRGPTYTDELIRRAVVEGIDAEGAALYAGMPRWQLGDDDWQNLLLFMETLH